MQPSNESEKGEIVACTKSEGGLGLDDFIEAMTYIYDKYGIGEILGIEFYSESNKTSWTIASIRVENGFVTLNGES